jgi:hypothetical protein
MAPSGFGHENWQSVVRRPALPPFSLQRGAKFSEGTGEWPKNELSKTKGHDRPKQQKEIKL